MMAAGGLGNTAVGGQLIHSFFPQYYVDLNLT